eukprot:s663_g17.t1
MDESRRIKRKVFLADERLQQLESQMGVLLSKGLPVVQGNDAGPKYHEGVAQMQLPDQEFDLPYDVGPDLDFDVRFSLPRLVPESRSARGREPLLMRSRDLLRPLRSMRPERRERRVRPVSPSWKMSPPRAWRLTRKMLSAKRSWNKWRLQRWQQVKPENWSPNREMSSRSSNLGLRDH